jgi:hypothetical protein
VGKAIDLIDQNPAMLSDDGQVIVQINPLEWVEKAYANLKVFDFKKYMETPCWFFWKNQWVMTSLMTFFFVCDNCPQKGLPLARWRITSGRSV